MDFIPCLREETGIENGGDLGVNWKTSYVVGTCISLVVFCACVDREALKSLETEGRAWVKGEPARYSYQLTMRCGWSHCFEGDFRVHALKDSVYEAVLLSEGKSTPVNYALQDLNIDLIFSLLHAWVEVGSKSEFRFNKDFHFPEHAVVKVAKDGGWTWEISIRDFKVE